MNDQIDPPERHGLTALRTIRARRSNFRARLVLLLIVAAALLGAVGYWYVTKDYISTDDAYTDGRAITVASQVAGRVIALQVTDNERVNSGDTLVRIDPSSFKAARDQAAAQLQVAEAQLASARVAPEAARTTSPARLEAARAQRSAAWAVQFKAQPDARRQRGLPRQATTQQEIDTAEAALRSADAQLGQA